MDASIVFSEPEALFDRALNGERIELTFQTRAQAVRATRWLNGARARAIRAMRKTDPIGAESHPYRQIWLDSKGSTVTIYDASKLAVKVRVTKEGEEG